jgi:DNA-binding IclR family transcriptional regulator
MTAEELVRRTDLPKTTVHRTVAELVRVGMLERTSSGLQLGTFMFELGQAAPGARSLREAARPVLADLGRATEMNVGLAVLEGTEVVYLDILAGRNAPLLPQRAGQRWPAHASCSGKAILAFADEAALEAALTAPLREFTPLTITDPETLRGELDEIRRRGAAFDRRESFNNVAGVAAPVFDYAGRAVAAVSISGVAGRINLPRFDMAARAAALAIARAYTSGPSFRTLRAR